MAILSVRLRSMAPEYRIVLVYAGVVDVRGSGRTGRYFGSYRDSNLYGM